MKRLILYSSILLVITSCNEDDDLPCANAGLPSINIETFSAIEDSLFREDTFLVSSTSEVNITFSISADDKNYDSLAWTIGGDPRTFTEPSFSLWFDIRNIGVLDVALTVWRTPNECFPDDSVLNLQKQIHLLSREDTPYAFEGTFTGYNESDPARIFDVTIVNFGPFPPPIDDSQYWLHVHNLTEGCGNEEISSTNRIPEIEMASYRHFYIDDGAIVRNDCQAIEGYGRVDLAGSRLIVDYTYRATDTGEEIEDRFVGKRKSL